MGDQKDGLRGLTRFSDNEGDIIWPAWRAELKQRVAFEFGKIGNQIIEGEVKESDVDSGEVTEKINALVNALIPKTRAQIQTRSDWMEEFVVNSVEGASDEVCSIKKTKLTLIGKMSIVSAISKTKSSYFESIQEHGLVRGSKDKSLLKHVPRVPNASRVRFRMHKFALAHLKFSFAAPTSQAPTSERTAVNWHVMEPNLWPAAQN